ncbi:MAG: prepilin-type N-terminal cleavage/methylation domain-containing protein [Bacilli bacterium]|nr:prepilin-type N-terminal cleavage/methylation domain-containing protein [Bacilli bacterium]
MSNNKEARYKTKEQGFTLIEVLAVIIILGIIMAIIIPIVEDVIMDAKKDTFFYQHIK